MLHHLVRRLLPGLFALCAGTAAHTASSTWIETEGGPVRIITDGAADAEGMLRGVLQIDLQPGWKTYWRDPGDAGVAPSVTLPSARGTVEIGFPAPVRLDDGLSAGYDQAVSLPLTFRFGGDRMQAVDADLFLGVCKEICVPVQASLTIDPSAPDDPVDAATVADAFAALPQAATPGFRVTGRIGKPLEIIAEAELPPGATDAELFVAGTERYALGAAEKISEAGGRASFRIEVLSAPAGIAWGSRIVFPYTLKAGEASVQGTIELDAM